MKKRLFIILLLISIFIMGCSQLQDTSVEGIEEDILTNIAENKEVILEKYLSNLEILEAPVREYGENTGVVQLDEEFMVRILYPEGELPELDKSIKTWVEDTVFYYQEEAKSSNESGDSAELTAEYESFVVGNDIDDALLDNWVLKDDCLEIILERGEYLPMSEGTVVLEYPFTELASIIKDPYLKQSEESNEDDTESEMPENVINTQSSTIDPTKPMIALTFDDGPSKHTERLLDIFAQYGGKGTFFVVGNIIEKRGETLKRMVTEGHEIGGHSWDHRQLTKLTSEDVTDQIMNTRAKIFSLTGVDTTIMRPPYGSYNDETKRICAENGIVIINWSLDTLDWKTRDADKVYNAIMSEVKDGDIILCHDLHGSTVDAMERVIPDLIEQGYQLVTVLELLSYGDYEVNPGTVHTKK